MSELNKTITVTAEMRIPFSPEAIWPQLCPVREYDWIEVWKCEMVHSVSGYNELGCVFKTDFPTECGEEVWMTSRFEPYERIEFVRTNTARIIHFAIVLSPDEGGTNMTWTQHVTPLNAAGEEYIKTKPEVFADQMSMLEKMLNHYLETGAMMKGKDLGLMERIKLHVYSRKTG